MRRIVSLITLTFVSLMVLAQSQQGYVKTKGRLGNNGTVIAGSRLSGATVQVKGSNAVVSGSKGTFTLSIPGNSYYLQSVQKQGYVMTDPDILSHQYSYSKNPLVLVLETPGQQADDKLAAERKIRRTLQRRLQDREDEIESLKKQQKLTEEEYRKQLQDIYAQQESNEKLISEMADRYSRMDFDEVDEFNRRISSLILEGKLTEADSLLNTKGDINSRAEALRQHQEANVQAEQDIKKKQKKLEKSKLLAQKELEDLAQDCYSKFEIFKMQHQNDTAAYYLKLRAALDTTNLQWQNDAARFLEVYQAKYTESMTYYLKVLRDAIALYGENHAIVSSAYNNIGRILSYKDNMDESVENLQKALYINKRIFGESHHEVAIDYAALGHTYSRFAKNETAMNYFLKAKEIAMSDTIVDESLCANIYDGLSVAFGGISNYDSALVYIQKSIEIQKKEKSPKVADSYNALGAYYVDLGNYSQAIDCYEKALDIYRNFFDENHPSIARNYSLISYVLVTKGEFIQALDMIQKAISIQLLIYGENNSIVAASFQTMGYIYSCLGDNKKSLESLLKSLELLKKIGTHTNMLAQSYNNVGYLYYLLKDYQKALGYHQEALKLRIENFGEIHVDIAQSYDNIGLALFGMGRYDEALHSHQQALQVRQKVTTEELPTWAWSYLGIGDVCMVKGRYDEAIENYTKAYNVRKKVLSENHPEVIICSSKLAEAYSAKRKKNKK